MKNKIKFKPLDKYQWKNTYSIKVYRSIDHDSGHDIVEFDEPVAEMNRRHGIDDLKNTRFTFETEGDMLVFMITWGSL